MGKKYRIFIAINLPDDIKKKLIDFQKKWAYLPMRWTKPENIHITLVFIGYATNEQVAEIRRVAREIAKKRQQFIVQFKKICLGPPGQPSRMIWLEGEKSKELADLKNNLENVLLDSKNSGYNHRETREFHPHITLGRFKYPQSRAAAPKIDTEFSESFVVKSVEVMESVLKRSGAEYAALESVDLG